MAVDHEAGFLWSLCAANTAQTQMVLQRRITGEMFHLHDAAAAFVFGHHDKYGRFPSPQTLRQRYPSISQGKEPLAYYADQLVERHLYQELREVVRKVSKLMQTDGDGNMRKAITEMAGVQGLLAQGYSADVSWRDWDAYAHYRDREQKGIVWKTPYRLLNRMVRGARSQQLWSIVARSGLCKCVARGTLLPDPDTGIWVPVENVVRKRSDVLSWTGTCITAQTPSAWLCTGRKQCYRLEHMFGDPLTVTPEHPVLTSGGWVKARDIKKGDRIAVVRTLPEPTVLTRVPSAEIDFVAILLSEGSISGHHVGFSTSDAAFLRRARGCARELGMRVVHRAAYDYDFVGKVHHRASIARVLLRKHGMDREKAKDKRVPSHLFSLALPQLARFLSVLWAGDGYVSECGRLEIAFASEGLVDDVRRLLLRFGVIATKRALRPTAVRGGRRFRAWRLSVISTCTHTMQHVLREVGGAKGRAIASLRPVGNTNVDVIQLPAQAADRIREEFSKGLRIAGTENRCFLGTQYGGRVTRRRLQYLLNNSGGRLEDLRWLVSDSIAWSVVRGKRSAGVREVYDFTVPRHHNFVANSVVCHNTWFMVLFGICFWEQGADVLFISKEMGAGEIYERLDALMFDMDWTAYTNGKIPLAVMQAHERHRKKVLAARSNRFIVNDSEEMTANDIFSVQAKIREHRPAIVMLDGAYLLDDAKGKTTTEKWGNLSRATKRMARSEKVCLWQTLQMNRGVDESPDALTNVYGSDAYAQDSDGVLHVKGKRTDDTRTIELLKARTQVGVGAGAFYVSARFSPKVCLAELGTKAGDPKTVAVDRRDG